MMNPQMEIIVSGALTTVQDAGRKGYAAKGYPECGAADKYAMQLANVLAGNGALFGSDAQKNAMQRNAAVLECTLMGASIKAAQSTLVAIAGAVCTPLLNGNPAPMFAPILLKAGDTLAIGACKTGLRSYLAVYGGIDLPAVMGSRATDTKCGIGGLEGRALKVGDVLPLAPSATGRAAEKAYAKILKNAKKRGFEQIAKGAGLKDAWLQTPIYNSKWQGDKRSPILRVVLGPQDDAFTAAGIKTFTSTLYSLTVDSNRMACKLKGAAIETVNGSDIISDGIVEGSVQVASDGQPIVMIADHQTTGGYAKIATVILPDVSVLAQLRPSDTVGFMAISPEEAVDIYRQSTEKLEWLEEQIL